MAAMDARPRRRPWWWLAGALALILAIVGIALTFPHPPDDQPARAAALVGESLRTGRVAPGAFDAADADVQLGLLRKGMGTLLPEVVVTDVAASDDGTGTAALQQTWTIHQGKPAWVYRSTVALRRTSSGWVGVWSPEVVHPSLRAGDQLRATRLAARRGEVIGAGDIRLVFRQSVNRVVVDLSLVDRVTAVASARKVAEILSMNPEPLVKRVEAAAASASVEVGTLRTLDPGQRSALEAVQALPGVGTYFTERMLALSPGFARPFLGAVGPATADAIAASEGAVREGDLVGLSGLQAAQDRTLRGATGFVVQRLAPEGASELFRVEPLAGTSVRVALDQAQQERADAAVAAASGAASVVVLRPSDGYVLAVASAGGDGVSLATQGRFALGPVPDGVPDAVAPLRWGTSGDLGVPVFLGETSSEAWASPLGLAEAAASAATGQAVIPVLVRDGEPARPALSTAQREALAALVAQADARAEWAVRVTGDLVVVAQGEAADAVVAAAG